MIVMGAAPNGLNINDQVGATVPQYLLQAVRAHRADVGIALDGDGDRLAMVDAEGRIFEGDELLYVLACDTQRHGGLIGGVAGTVMSNLGLEHALNRRGMAFARASVGDRHVLQLLKQRGWRLGGESSGHIICLDHHSTGDGVIAALQVLGAMRRAGKGLAQLCDGLSLHAQCMVNVPVHAHDSLENNAQVQRCRQRAELELGDQGRVLLLASGTEPVLRVMVECLSAVQAEAVATRLASEVAEALRNPFERELLAA